MDNRCKYLIVGGGMTADTAARAIRELDKDGKLIMLSSEPHPPYDRPPLSKKLWAGKPLESIWRNTAELGVELHLNTRAVAGDGKRLSDSHGNVYACDKLLLATGGTPRHLPFTDHDVIYFRTMEDYLRVRTLAADHASFIVIGGGFIGSEIAAALAMYGSKVTMIFPERGLGARIFPAGLSGFLTSQYRDKGVDLLPEENVVAVVRTAAKTAVTTRSGKTLYADAVIAGIGIEPEVSLAKALGLAVDNGVIVDKHLRTTREDIYAAGDVANFYSSALGHRRRVEHEDNANSMGTVAGRNMAGESEIYDHLPYFYSDLFDSGYEAVGEFASDYDIIEDWAEPFRKGVVYYLRSGRVRGVLLWNTWGQIDAARGLISVPDHVDSESLRGRISG